MRNLSNFLSEMIAGNSLNQAHPCGYAEKGQYGSQFYCNAVHKKGSYQESQRCSCKHKGQGHSQSGE